MPVGTDVSAVTKKTVDNDLRWDFRPGVPDLTSFPGNEWQNALREVLRTSPASFPRFLFGGPSIDHDP